VFEIDHIPVAHHDLDRLAGVFAALGFRVTEACVYVSPDDPSGRWTCRSVFLRHGWLDLQGLPERPAEAPAAPTSCLFRAPHAADAGLAGLRLGPAFRLVRTWDAGPDLALSWMSVRERIAPVVLAVATYPGRAPDADTGAPDHPDTAARVLGLIFGGADPGPAAEAAGAIFDLSGFRHLSATAFEARFGRPPGGLTALRLGVRSLEAAAAAVAAGGLTFRREGPALLVPAQGDLGCGVEFVAEAAG
jgi:hypothetical protein